jgi:SAM-dependent methyltransferase
MYSELTDKSQLEASVTDSGIIEMRGSKIVGLKPGGAQVRLQYGQCEADLQVLVSEAVPYVWTPEIPHCRFFEEMKKVPNALIVEVGSYNVIDLMPRHHLNPDAKVVGVDIRAGDNVDVVCDAHQLSSKLQPGTFDGVYSCSVFEHLAIPWQVVLEINRVLKIGGVAHVATIHTFPVHEMPWDFWRYGKHCFPSLFGPKSGFEIINHCVQLPGEFRYPVTGHRFRVGERIYLFSMVTARKVAEYDESRFHWRIPIEEILPKDHFYPDREDLYRTMAQSKGTPEEGYRMIDQYFQSLTGSRSARLLVLHSTNANNSIDDRFVSSYLRNHSAGILNGQGTHLDVVVRDYRTVEDALNLYRLPEEFGEEQFDFVLASDVLRLTEYPWKAALMISKMLKKDGRLLVKDWQARPIDVEPDYWRMTREAYRVLFNPRFGMNVEQTIHTDAVELFPEGVALKCYDHTIPCYFTTIGLATKVGPCNATGLRWDE